MKEMNKWEKIFADFINYIEFSLEKDDDGYWLQDMQHANLGDIESDRFNSASEILDRVDIYINDYIIEPINENNDICFDYYPDYLEWAKSNIPHEWSVYPFEMLDMIVNHFEDIDIDKVYEEVYKEK